MTVSPHSPRRQRKALYTADSFERRARMTVPLSRELRARFHRHALSVRKGDTVRVLSGSFAGREERVARVNRRSYSVTLENVTLKTADEKMKALTLSVGHLVITRLNLADPWRRRSMRVPEEVVTPEERGEAAEGEEAPEGEKVPEAAPAPEPATAGTPAEPEGTPSEGDTEGTNTTEGAPPAKPPRRARARPVEEEEA